MKRSDGAAPLPGSERASAATVNDYETCPSSSRRARRRGPRSALSCLRRSQKGCGGASADMVTSEAVTPLSVNFDSHSSAPLVIYCINIRCLLAHSAELSYQLEVHKPHLVLIQESWLSRCYAASLWPERLFQDKELR